MNYVYDAETGGAIPVDYCEDDDSSWQQLDTTNNVQVLEATYNLNEDTANDKNI